MMVKFTTYKLIVIAILSLAGYGNMFTKNKAKFHYLIGWIFVFFSLLKTNSIKIVLIFLMKKY